MDTRARGQEAVALRPSESLELARRLLAGDEVLFQDLVAQLHPGLRRLARAIVGNAATADDVAQETWKAVLRSLEGFEGRSTLRTWVHRICVNVALARVSEDLRSPLLEGCGVLPESRIDETPETLLLRGELVHSIHRAVAALPVSQRAVIVLRDIEGFSADEACEILGLTDVNQRVLLHRARQRVRSSCEHLDSAAPPSSRHSGTERGNEALGASRGRSAA